MNQVDLIASASVSWAPCATALSPDGGLIAVGGAQFTGETWTGRVDLYAADAWDGIQSVRAPVDGVPTASGLTDIIWVDRHEFFFLRFWI